MDPNTINQFFEKLKPIVQKYEERRKKRMKLGFNVFKIISDHYYRETFHGDILYAILSPESRHDEGSLYVNLFIDMINDIINQTGKKKIAYYDNVSVEKEYGTNDGENAGRIDLLILGEILDEAHRKKHCIIIENKLNNATDTYQQLPKYYNDLHSKGYIIDAFVYLPLDPDKRPETKDWGKDVKKIIEDNLFIIPAYAPNRINLVNNWLECAERRAHNQDVSFVIKHYKSLLNNLTINVMDNSALTSICINNDNFDSTMAILENSSAISNAIIIEFILKLKERVENEHLGTLSSDKIDHIVVAINDSWSYTIERYSNHQYWRGLIYLGSNELPPISEQIWVKAHGGYPMGWDYFAENKGWCNWDKPSTLRALHNGEFLDFIINEIVDAKKAIDNLR